MLTKSSAATVRSTTEVTPETEIVSAALRMIRDYGLSAAERADRRAAAFLRDNDKDGCVLWQKIAETIRAVQADDPAHWFGREDASGDRRRTKR
jgi:hypothetical protein